MITVRQWSYTMATNVETDLDAFYWQFQLKVGIGV